MKKPRNGSFYIKTQTRDHHTSIDGFHFQKSSSGGESCSFQKSTGGESCKSKSKKCYKSKSFYELSLSLIFSLWCLVFLFYSKLGLGHGNGGNSAPDHRSTHCPSVHNGKHGDDACSFVENGMVLDFTSSQNCNDSGVCDNYAISKYSLPETNRLVWSILVPIQL